MARKPVTRLPNSGKQKPTVDPEVLVELREAREKALMASVEAQEIDASFRRMLASACRDIGVPIETSVLCLNCGTARQAGQGECSCSGG